MNRDKIIDLCEELQPIYFCISDEIGIEEKTPHTHIFILFENARAFNTIKNSFQSAHIDKCFGTNQENRDYVFKIGKWLDDEKEETNIRESHYEYGDLPLNEQGKRNDLSIIYECIDQGYSAFDIIEENPQFTFRLEDIKKIINAKKQKEFRETFRHIHTTYICGSTATGKTRYVMDTYGYGNVYRVTDYRHPFDNYEYEDVIMFEEFREDLQIKDMLKYLDGYPISLPARYSNVQACFTKVFIVSNIKIRDQYIEAQNNEKETYKAFIRRINTIMEFDEYGNKYVFTDLNKYENRQYITLEEYEKGDSGNEE